MTKVEEVARAICAAEDYNPDADYQPLGKPAGPFWLEFVSHARAAIEAMKGPTIAMKKAGLGWREYDVDAEGEARITQAGYHAMLQAALDE